MKDDLFDLYFKYCEDTEPPAVFHRWSLIGCIGAYLGRQMWLPFNGRLFPNQYIMFVGDPGTRKSSAIKRATKLIGAAGFDKFGAQKTSMEKFLLDLQDGGIGNDEVSETAFTKSKGEKALDILMTLKLKGADNDTSDEEPREMFVAADEFNNFLGSGNITFQSLLGELWDWDEPDRFYKQRLKNSKSVSIYQPTINILAGNTPSSFADCFPLASIGQGFMSRLILVHGESTGKKITFPKEPSESLKTQIINHFRRMKLQCQGAMTIEDEAKAALDMIYKGAVPLEDQRFQHYSTRRFTHLLKVVMVVCAARLSTHVTVPDVLYANTVLSFIEATMPKAIGELGKSKNAEAANKIMQALYTTRHPLTMQDLWKIVDKDVDKMGDLANLLLNLQQSDKIQSVEPATGKKGFLPKQKPMSRTAPYTNFEILKGREYV